MSFHVPVAVMGLDVSTPAIVTMRQHVILSMENVIAGLALVEIGEKHYEFTIFDLDEKMK